MTITIVNHQRDPTRNIMFGDSIVNGGSNVSAGGDATFSRYTTKLLTCIGLGGAAIPAIEDLIDDYYNAKGDDAFTGTTVVVNGGLNNFPLGDDTQDMEDDMNALLDTLETYNANDVVLLGCTPWGVGNTSVPDSSTHRTQREDFNSNMATEIGTRNSGNPGTWTFIDPDPIMGDGDGAGEVHAQLGYSWDTVHLTYVALKEIAEAIDPYLQDTPAVT